MKTPWIKEFAEDLSGDIPPLKETGLFTLAGIISSIYNYFFHNIDTRPIKPNDIANTMGNNDDSDSTF